MSIVALYDGHRKKIPVTPGTSMSDVLKKACESLGLTNVERYELRHKNSTVDLSLPFRLSGISSNAILEVREVSGSRVQNIRVCIQHADGTRVQGNFTPSATLLEILNQLNVTTDNSLNFMRRELEPEEFPSLTLQTLGLLSGSVMFRVLGAASADVHVGQNPTNPTQPAKQPTPVFASSRNTPEINAPKPSTSPSPLEVVKMSDNANIQYVEDVNMGEDDTSDKIPVLSTYEAIQHVRNNCFDAVSKTVVLTLMKIVCNLLSNPGDTKVRSIRVGNVKFNENVGKHLGGLAFLNSIGFEFDANKEFLVLTNENSSVLQQSLDILHSEADDLGIDKSQRPVVIVPTNSTSVDFDAFKPIITRVQAQPRGASITEIRLENLKKKEEVLLAVNIPPRNPRMFFPHEQLPAMSSVQSNSGVATSSDAQLLAKAMRTRQEEAEKSQAFRTRAMRELDEMQKKTVFQSTVLRIRFPDQVTLQGAFHPNETIPSLVSFLKEHLHDDAPKFSLYITPPKQTFDLASTKTFTELNLVPAALVYLAWTTPVQSRQIGAYFKESLEDLGAESKEDDSNQSAMYPVSHTLDAAASQSKSSTHVVASSEAKSSSKGKGSKPSWLKL
ncbi:hypothetical protein Ae201684P_020950 [Aphanomyces euteiches]|nr:hypothetical protein Ae201684P_020950 [Aphanomyces euteiches]